MHPFAARVVHSCPFVLLHQSGVHNCLTRCRLQMFLKPQVCVEYGNQTCEHQSGTKSSNLTRSGVTHSPPHPTNKFLWTIVHPYPITEEDIMDCNGRVPEQFESSLDDQENLLDIIESSL